MHIFKIKFSFLFYVITLISILTGIFKNYISFISLIFIHELGHAMAAYLLKWKVDKIEIFPFGGVTKFSEKINKPMLEEFLILIAGPLTQIIYVSFIKTFFKPTSFFLSAHRFLLFFNLLPIYPLDGGKLFYLFYETIFPYFLSHKIMFYSSIIFILIFSFNFLKFKFSYFIILSFFLLFIKLVKEKKDEKIIFNKFLLERLLYDFDFNFVKTVGGDNIKKMYRDYNHFFNIEGERINEKSILKRYFNILNKS